MEFGVQFRQPVRCHHQTCKPVWNGRCENHRRGLQECVGLRPSKCIWRNRRPESHGERSGCRTVSRHVHRSRHCSRIHPGRFGTSGVEKNLRIIAAEQPVGGHVHMRSIDGGMLVQDVDVVETPTESWRVVSTTTPTEEQLADAVVAWVACASVSSNAITLVRNGQTVGIGGGQQNRVDAARLACERAGDRAHGAVAASDAFFPFRDGPDLLAHHGVAVIVQPGGSQRDEESIAAANEHGMVMIFTGTRHFRH